MKRVAVAAAAMMLSVATAGICSESDVIRLYDRSPAPRVTARCLTVEVGDSTRAVFAPSFQLSAWAGECRMRMNLATSELPLDGATRTVTTDQLGRKKVALETDKSRHELFVRPDCAFEWTIVLPRRPLSNRLVFAFESTGLTFHYQDSLTEYERDSLGCRRADSVVGSYAVYHASARGNRRAIRGVDTTWQHYESGKAFHIYRPRATDRAGAWAWCELVIDTLRLTLTIALPPAFLDKAIFPITVDPTFGTTSEGASDFFMAGNHVRHCEYPMGTSPGTIDSITCCVRYDGTSDSLGVAIYEDGGDVPYALFAQCTARQVSDDWSTRWYSFAVESDSALHGGTNYWLSLLVDAGSYFRYDDLGSGDTEGHFNDPWPPSDPASRNWNHQSYTFSIYCTYTVTVSDLTSRRRTIICGGP